jgi:glutathione S-transferase
MAHLLPKPGQAVQTSHQQGNPQITLFFLQASRAIRVAWLLHELLLPYELTFFDRLREKAPPELKEVSVNPLGKSPTISLDGVTIQESGAICECLCQRFDSEGRLTGGQDLGRRAKVLEWVHAAEGTFMVHALAVLYARWTVPGTDALAAAEKGLSANVHKDLDWLDAELAKSASGWLVGDSLTVADIMVHFSVEFIFARRLGLKDVTGGEERWVHVKEWLAKCAGCGSYKKAVEKTGYTLFPETGVNWRDHV